MYSELELQLRHLLLFATQVHPYFACAGKQTENNLHKTVVTIRYSLLRLKPVLNYPSIQRKWTNYFRTVFR